MKKVWNVLLMLFCTVVIIVTAIIGFTYVEGKYVGKSFLLIADEDTGNLYATSDIEINHETKCIQLKDNNSVEICKFYIKQIVFKN